MRGVAVVVALATVALVSGLATYEWRSVDEPARVEPIELRPAPEREQPSERPRPERRRAKESPSTGSAPVATPPPAPAGGGGDDDADDGDDDDGGDDGDD